MRVLLTRPRADAEATAERVAALGHAAVIAPLLDIVPESGQPDLAGAGALIVTSANALRVLPASALRSVRGLPLFAVGARTAAAARACGFADVRSAAGDAEALLALILSASPQGTLVHLAGRDRAGELVPRLAAAGFTARVATVYRAMALDRLPGPAAEGLAAGNIGAVLHYSRRSAETFVRLVAAQGLGGAAARPAHLCLSRAVAEPLEAAGLGQAWIAARPAEQELLALLRIVAAGDSARK